MPGARVDDVPFLQMPPIIRPAVEKERVARINA
jgi:hypothetical protein